MSGRNIYRRELPYIILLITALITLSEYFFKQGFIIDLSSEFRKWTVIIGNCGLFVGLISITIVNYRKIKTRQEGHWYFAIWLIIIMYSTIILGLTQGMLSDIYLAFFGAFNISLYTATTGLLLFFIASACYRSFIVRNVDSTLIMITAVILWICNAPFGELITSKSLDISNWFNFYLNMGAIRGYNIGIATGGIALGVRTLLGRERGAISFGREQE